MSLRGPLFVKYAMPIMALAGVALLVSATIEIYFSHRLHRAMLLTVLRDKADVTASSVSRYVEELTHQIGRGTMPASGVTAAGLDKRRIDYLILLRLAPPITTLRFVDPRGLERLQVSRLDADRANSAIDRSRDPGVLAARGGQIHFSQIYFFEQTEPYMSIAVPDSSGDGSVTLAEVNLKFIWMLVTEMKIGEQGYAYVVDAGGRLVAHPDIHRVLQVTDLSKLPQIRAAFSGRDSVRDSPGIRDDAIDSQGRPVLAAYAAIPPLGWFAFAEQLRSEAFAPLSASLSRTAVILLLAMAIALLASLLLARRMVAPIRHLQDGARKIGAGELGHRISVDTGDELEELSHQFNRMSAQLQASYAHLESRIAERTRDLQAANDAKSRFLAAASHDLRQPIHALGLLAAQLEACTSAHDRCAAIAQISHGIDKLGGLFDDLLDISKLEGGGVVARLQHFPIASLFEAARAQFAPAARAKGLRFPVRLTDRWVHSDPILLKRILLNFVSNAVRYTQRGGVLIGCRKRGEHLQIGVWDTGCGIPADCREDVFREFVQLPNVDRDRSSGLGLGLAIVARLAPLIGGTIDLESTWGRGSMFAIRVPLADVACDARKQSIGDLDLPPIAASRGIFVVVVDDDPGACSALQALLGRWGCLAIATSSSAEALAKLEQHERAPDLLVCDYHLADGDDGIEAIRRIRSACKREMPAILITADASAEVLQAAQALRYPVLRKPVAPAKLRALLTRLLTKAPAEQGLDLSSKPARATVRLS